MKARLPLVAILASSLVFLASLYLTWVDEASQAASASRAGGLSGLLNLLSGGGFARSGYAGWDTASGQAAGVCALTLCAGAAAALARRELAARLPFARIALALVVLAIIALAQGRADGLFIGAFDRARTGIGSGAYLGVAMAVVALLASAALHWDDRKWPSPGEVLAASLTGGLFAAFLAPALTFQPPHVGNGGAIGYQVFFTGSYAATFTVVIACLAIPLWRRGGPPAGRVAAGGALALLAAGHLSALGVHRHWPWEAWLWLGCALGLFLLALATARGARVPRPSRSEAAIVVTACALLVSLFLPWEHGGFSPSGWEGSSDAGALAVVLLGALLGWRRLLPEIGLSVGFYVVAAGVDVTEFGSPAYGSIIGFAATALLLYAIVLRQRDASVLASLPLSRIVPIAACLSFLAIPIAGLTTFRLELESPWQLSLLLLAAVVIDFRLLGRWFGTGPNAEVVLLPLALLALVGLDLVFIRDRIHWEGWLSLALVVFLLGCGWVARNGGIPEEIWRVDRLPAVED